MLYAPQPLADLGASATIHGRCPCRGRQEWSRAHRNGHDILGAKTSGWLRCLSVLVAGDSAICGRLAALIVSLIKVLQRHQNVVHQIGVRLRFGCGLVASTTSLCVSWTPKATILGPCFLGGGGLGLQFSNRSGLRPAVICHKPKTSLLVGNCLRFDFNSVRVGAAGDIATQIANVATQGLEPKMGNDIGPEIGPARKIRKIGITA